MELVKTVCYNANVVVVNAAIVGLAPCSLQHSTLGRSLVRLSGLVQPQQALLRRQLRAQQGADFITYKFKFWRGDNPGANPTTFEFTTTTPAL
jgi:hypothetical protein